MSILDDIMTQLEADSVSGGATGWTTKKSLMPPAPDQIVGIFETGGGDVDQTQGVSQFDGHGFQVRVRGTAFDYDGARAKIAEAFTSLNNVTLSGYIFIFADSIQPLPLGLDTNDRPELAMNFTVLKTR